MATNLPQPERNDSAEKTKLVFNNYGQKPNEYRAIDVDSCLAFFIKRGFSEDAAQSVTTVLLAQAKREKVAVSAILDSIAKTNETQLSVFVSQIMNNNRVATSTLGVRTEVPVSNQTRNIIV